MSKNSLCFFILLFSSSIAVAADCNDKNIKSLMIEEFNRAAEAKFLPSAIDLATIQTETFNIENDENLDVSCMYEVLLDSNKKQKFRLMLESNSLGRLYIRFQPQGSSY